MKNLFVLTETTKLLLKIHNNLLLFVVGILMLSCNYFKPNENKTIIARVNDTYLYAEDLQNLIGEGTSDTDSTLLVTNYINRWATQQLLISGAKLNLSEQQQHDFNKLVEQYRSDLYTKAYLEALVSKNLDSSLTQAEVQKYYEQNKSTFLLNDNIIKFRYIRFENLRQDINDLKSRLKRFSEADKKYLDSIALQFKSYNLNDSIWIKQDQIVQKIPSITIENRDILLKKSNLFELKDSLGVYLIYIKDVLVRNDVAPLQYIEPTINQIVINKRKLELIKELKKDITKDAIRSKKFEIY